MPKPSQRYLDIAQKIEKKFPVNGYFTVGFDAHFHIGRVVQSLLPKAAKVLDVGCGPADKTAFLAQLGYTCTGYDDFQDHWHRRNGMLKKLFKFGRDTGVNMIEADKDYNLPFADDEFDLIMSCDVIEHLHQSPREMMNNLLPKLREEGYVLITVPNAVNLRKRIDVLRGKTNYPPYPQFYWMPGNWRGHVREYTKDDLAQMTAFLGLELVLLRGADHMLHTLPAWARPIFKLISTPFEGFKDSWILVARKPKGWTDQREITDERLKAVGLGSFVES